MLYLSNNENRYALAFQKAELSIIVGLYGIFKFVHTPSTFGTRNGNEDDLLGLITRQMKHILHQTGRSSVKNF
jgi:hypothetical protein